MATETQKQINALTADERAMVLEKALKIAQTALIINSEKEFCTFLNFQGHCTSLSIEVTPSKAAFIQKLYTANLSLSPYFTSKDEVAGWIKSFVKKYDIIQDELQKYINSEVVSYVKVRFDDGIVNISKDFDIDKIKEARDYAREKEVTYNLAYECVKVLVDTYQSKVQ